MPTHIPLNMWQNVNKKQKQFPKSHKEHSMVCFAKGTKNEHKDYKPNSINEIKNNTNAADTDNNDTSIHMYQNDLELSSDNLDFWQNDPPVKDR